MCDRLAELARVGEHRHRFAEVDETTGLLNSRGFRRRLAAALGDGRPGQPVSLVLVDNTGIAVPRGPGDAAGRALRELADRLRNAAPEHAALGRVDDAVLGALLPGRTRAEALRWAERLRAPLSPAGRAGPPPINVGVAQHRVGSSVDQLISDADHALAAASRPGRHQVLADPTERGGLEEATAGGAGDEPLTAPPLAAAGLLARVGSGAESRATGRHAAPEADQPEPRPDVAADRASFDEPGLKAPRWQQTGGGTGANLDPVDVDTEFVADGVLPPPGLPTPPSLDGPVGSPAPSGPATDPGGAEDPWDDGSGQPKAAPQPGTEPSAPPSGPAAASLPHPSTGSLDVPAPNGSVAPADEVGLAELLAEALAAYQRGREEESCAELDPSAQREFFEAPTVPQMDSGLRSPGRRATG